MFSFYKKGKKQPLITAAFFCMAMITCLQLSAQDTTTTEFKPHGKIWGYMFGDMFYKVGGDTLSFGKSEYAGAAKNTLGGKLRRIYFGYDYNLSPRWSTRFLLESNASTLTPGGNFGVLVKLGYLQYNNVIKKIPNSVLKMGLIPTPVFAFPEKSWGYRSVEKEALELRGLGNAADQGASLEGNFDKKAESGFTVMIGNGSGYKPGAGKYLEYYLSVYKKFLDKKLNLELMVDHKKIDKDLSRTLIRGFISYELSNLRVGAEVAPNFVDEKVSVGPQKLPVHTQPLLTSVFVSTRMFNEAWLFLRYDYVNPDMDYHPEYKYANATQDYDEHLFIGGFQIQVHDHVNIMPNLHVNTYHKKKDAIIERKPDVVLRTTVYFSF